MLIGLIVNPIAGLGGSVGLKGTDGVGTAARARALGAVPVAATRTARALAVLAGCAPGTAMLVAAGAMGADALAGADLAATLVPLDAAPSAAETRRVAALMRDAGVDLLLFAGGDGTARDIVSVIGSGVPLLGIPCGVKMHSGVFAVTPEAAGRLVCAMLDGSARIDHELAEIVDVDEDALRAGTLAVRLYGHGLVPRSRRLVQSAKGPPPRSDRARLEGVAAEIAGELAAGVPYLVGPGTTAKLVLAAMGIEGDLLGVDAVRDGVLVGRDIGAAAALHLAGDGPLGIVVGVTGRQGFVFGRGNQPIGPQAIRRAGRARITILADQGKLATLDQPVLRCDTGDPDLDRDLAGYWRVRTAPGRSMLMRLAP